MRARVCVCACVREREGETACGAGGGEGEGEGARLCAAASGESERAAGSPPAFPAARSCQARSESLLGLAGFSGGGWGQCHARLGGDGDPFAGSVSKRSRFGSGGVSGWRAGGGGGVRLAAVGRRRRSTPAPRSRRPNPSDGEKPCRLRAAPRSPTRPAALLPARPRRRRRRRRRAAPSGRLARFSTAGSAGTPSHCPYPFLQHRGQRRAHSAPRGRTALRSPRGAAPPPPTRDRGASRGPSVVCPSPPPPPLRLRGRPETRETRPSRGLGKQGIDCK